MAVSTREKRGSNTATMPRGRERAHLRILPSPAEDVAEGAATGVAGALYGAPGILWAVALLVFLGWVLDRIRLLEEAHEDRIDVEEARKALAEEGSISLAELKAELGL